MSGSQEEQTPEEIPGGYGSAMWEIRRLKAGATARSSTAARTAGLREVTGEKFKVTGSARPKPRNPPPGEHNPTDMDMPAVSGAEIL